MRSTVGAKGSVMVTCLGLALVCSIASYAILMVARAQVPAVRIFRERVRAKYAAEGALVWARDRLRQNPGETFAANPDVTVIDWNLRPIPVDIVATPRPLRPWQKRLEAKVEF